MKHISPPITRGLHENLAKKIALVTSADLPDLYGGEQLLPPVLRECGVLVDICVWNDHNVQWHLYDAVVIRCPWDYYEHFTEYMQWLDRLEKQAIHVINDIATLRWNLNKKYLLELAELGISIIPTELISQNDQRTLRTIMQDKAWTEMVLKPVESAGAWRTLKVTKETIDQAEISFATWRTENEYFCQPFMPEIVEVGEWSLIYFAGEFSHALIKSAKKDDFRVQSDHGGTFKVQEAPEYLRMQASLILQALPVTPCYARIDGIVRNHQLMLMEIELVEPELFLELDPDAAKKFAKAIMDQINHQCHSDE